MRFTTAQGKPGSQYAGNLYRYAGPCRMHRETGGTIWLIDGTQGSTYVQALLLDGDTGTLG